MNKKVLTLSAVMASMLFGAAAHAADTRIGVTIYKYDDNFMSVVRKAIEKDAKAAPDVQLLMNDSQNDQSKQNDQIDVLLAKGVKALAINPLTRQLLARSLKSTRTERTDRILQQRTFS